MQESLRTAAETLAVGTPFPHARPDAGVYPHRHGGIAFPARLNPRRRQGAVSQDAPTSGDSAGRPSGKEMP